MYRKEKNELSVRTEQRWPLIRNLMLCHFNEDYDLLYGSLQGAISRAVREGSVDQRRALLREWRDWNNSVGAADDIRPVLYNSFSVAVFFKQSSDARGFMNGIYDGLLDSVKADTQGKV
jgi:hypothetical protein